VEWAEYRAVSGNPFVALAVSSAVTSLAVLVWACVMLWCFLRMLWSIVRLVGRVL